jgi:hypothetical protein
MRVLGGTDGRPVSMRPHWIVLQAELAATHISVPGRGQRRALSQAGPGRLRDARREP